MVLVTMPKPLDKKFKSWAKYLDDIDESQNGGYAFVGEFIFLSKKRPQTYDMTPGQLILTYRESEGEGGGSAGFPTVNVFKVKEDGSLEELYACECDSSKGWARECTAEIKKIFMREKSFRPRHALKEMDKFLKKVVEHWENFAHSNLDTPFKLDDAYEHLKTIQNQVEGFAQQVKEANGEMKSSGIMDDIDFSDPQTGIDVSMPGHYDPERPEEDSPF